MSSTSNTSTMNTIVKTDYLQPSIPTSNSSSSYDPSQSPLALLAQTCSSIGKDCPSPPSSSSSPTITTTTTTTSTSVNLAPSVITSLVTRNSSNPMSISNSDKSILSSKRSSSTQIVNNHVHRKSTVPLKSPSVTKSSSLTDSNPFSNYLPPLFDPMASGTSTSAATAAAAALFLRSSLAYLAVQHQQQAQIHSQLHSYSTVCTMPGCLQCETLRHILSASTIPNEPFVCQWHSCNRRFSSNEELNDHIQRNHRSTKLNNIQRFHPYLKPSMMINNNDQLPFFYPHLSLSPMTGSTRRMNNNTNSNN